MSMFKILCCLQLLKKIQLPYSVLYHVFSRLLLQKCCAHLYSQVFCLILYSWIHICFPLFQNILKSQRRQTVWPRYHEYWYVVILHQHWLLVFYVDSIFNGRIK
ncbi:hypothetical protein MANES_06G167450v8 [Manihot esculenta]|uniref:Uncharacterized protein n=1 Tax=Manihot esculenta TaxID=3983 RepID=A0ACB7HKF0_MANES|nr:hypothetical protein MANES_06G167450v8 [Manihot esculenta]